MTDRALSRLAGITLAATLASFAVAGVLEWINDPLPGSDWGESGADYIFPLAILTFPLVGSVIASRRPRNSIGWIMLGIGLFTGLSGVSDGYIRYGLVTEPGSLPYVDVALALTAGSWVFIIAPIMTFLILLFPDGRLPSPRWRWAAYLAGLAMVLPYLLITIMPGNFEDVGYPAVENPLGIEALRPALNLLLSVLILLPIAIIGCAAGLVQRFRRSRGQERLQLKWLATAASFVAAVYAAAMAASLTIEEFSDHVPRWILWLQESTILSFTLIPIAIGVAILRHRLYNIDRLINRALVYAGLTGILTIAYLFLVAVLQNVLQPMAGSSDLTVAMSTLAVAAMFRPVRSRVQGFIDRRFYRKKYDATRTLETFASTMRNEVDLQSLSPALVGIVHETMQPSHASLWLRPAVSDPPVRRLDD